MKIEIKDEFHCLIVPFVQDVSVVVRNRVRDTREQVESFFVSILLLIVTTLQQNEHHYIETNKTNEHNSMPVKNN